MPLQVDHLLFNCAVVIHRGKILGIVPKTFLPNYREFYEYRQFAPAFAAHSSTVDVLGQGTFLWRRLLFQCQDDAGLPSLWKSADLWVPIRRPPALFIAAHSHFSLSVNITLPRTSIATV
jgi:NAD+ synthase (glutamine-hydrolysing)